MKNFLRKYFYKISFPFFYLKWFYYSIFNKKIKLLVGAGLTSYNSWFSTDVHFLDITKESDFRKLFKKRKIDNILAEHVLEHLTSEQLKLMVANFYKYSSENINIRIAVPDGFHNNPQYINQVIPGGTGNGAHDHKHLFNYKTLCEYFEAAGFKARLIEYWDEYKQFNTIYTNDDKGTIRRSFLNDKRNSDGLPNYTSLIIDFYK